MNITKSIALTMIATSIKLLNALFLVKLVSLYLGPEGLAKMGQFISFVTAITVVAGGGINQGLIKYVSEYRQDKEKLRGVISSGNFIVLSTSFLSFLLILIFRNNFSELIFNTKDYRYLFVFLSFAQFLLGLGNILTAIINGYKEIYKLTLVNIGGTVTSALLSIILIYSYGFEGILVAFILSQSMICFYSFYFCKTIKDFNLAYLIPKFNKENCVALAKFSLMLFTAALMAPLIQMATRKCLLIQLSWQEVGYWEGVTKISDAYLMLLTTVISVYCLPLMAEKKFKNETIVELLRILKIIFPLTIFLATQVFLFREYIILILFSPDFLPMKSLFFWQLMGDVIRLIAMFGSYFLISKALYKMYIFIEIFYGVMFLTLVYALVPLYGVEGAVYAFALNSVFFLAMSLCCVVWAIQRIPKESKEIYRTTAY